MHLESAKCELKRLIKFSYIPSSSSFLNKPPSNKPPFLISPPLECPKLNTPPGLNRAFTVALIKNTGLPNLSQLFRYLNFVKFFPKTPELEI